MFKSQYKIYGQLSPGIYQNRDQDFGWRKFFVRIIDDAIEIKYYNELTSCPLSDKIYYMPNGWPGYNGYDIREGSMYNDYFVPTNAFKFIVDQETVRVETDTTTVSLDSYVDTLYNQIQLEIKNIYSQHNHVVLSYSGGIDSIVLLSYIMNLGLLDKTTLLTHVNQVSAPGTTLFEENAEKKLAYAQLTKELGSTCRNIVLNTVTPQDLVNTINRTKSYVHTRAYTASHALQQFNNTAFLYGWGGNQALLHKDIFLDQILINTNSIEATKSTLVNQLSKANYYSQGLQNYDVNKTPTPLEYHLLMIRGWIELDGFQGNRVYHPIGTNFEQCRQIDFKNLDPSVILDAQVAREIVKRNVGSRLDDSIVVESLNDGDACVQTWFNTDQIDSMILTIPQHSKHDIEGLAWLERLCKEPQIELNTVISILLQQKIYNLMD
jgi:hypothetical protein